MDINIGCRSISKLFSLAHVVLYVNFRIYLISPSTIWYEFCHRTPIRLVSSLGGWTRTHALANVQQPQLCGSCQE